MQGKFTRKHKKWKFIKKKSTFIGDVKGLIWTTYGNHPRRKKIFLVKLISIYYRIITGLKTQHIQLSCHLTFWPPADLIGLCENTNRYMEEMIVQTDRLVKLRAKMEWTTIENRTEDVSFYRGS